MQEYAREAVGQTGENRCHCPPVPRITAGRPRGPHLVDRQAELGQLQAKALELRLAVSLGRLWQQQGKRTETHHLLALVYGWFTEGFDSAHAFRLARG